MFGRKNRPAPPAPVLSPEAQALLARLAGGRQAVGGALGLEAQNQQKGIEYFFQLLNSARPESRELAERCENLIAIIKLMRNRRRGAVLGNDKSLAEHLGVQEPALFQLLFQIGQRSGSNLNAAALADALYQPQRDTGQLQYGIDIIYGLLGGTADDLPLAVEEKAARFLQATNGLTWMPHLSARAINDASDVIEDETKKPAGQPQRTLQEITAAHGITLQPLTINWGAPAMPAPPAGVPVPVAVAPVPTPAVVPPAPAPAAVPAPAPVTPAVAAAPAPAPVPTPPAPTPALAPAAPAGIDRADILRDPALKEARDFLSRLLSHFIKTDVSALGDLDIKINDAISVYFGHEYPLGTALFVAKGRASQTGVVPQLLEILETTFKPADTTEIKQVILHVHAALKDLPELAAIAKPPAPGPQAAVPMTAPQAVIPPIPAAALTGPATPAPAPVPVAVPAAVPAPLAKPITGAAAAPQAVPAPAAARPIPVSAPAPAPAPAPAAPDPRVEKEKALRAAVNWFNLTLIPALFQSQDLSLAEEINQRFLGYLATFQQTGPKIGNRIYSEALDGETDIQRIIPKVINTKNPEALIIVLYKLIKDLDLTPHAPVVAAGPVPAPARAVAIPVAVPRPAAAPIPVPVPAGARPAVPVAVAAQPLTREAAARRYQAGLNQFCDQATRLLSSPLNTPADISALEISIRDMERLYTDAMFAGIQPDERISQLQLELIMHKGRSVFADLQHAPSEVEKQNLFRWYFERFKEGISNPVVAQAVVADLNWFCQNHYPNLWNDFLKFLGEHSGDTALYQKLTRNGVIAAIEPFFGRRGFLAASMGLRTA